MTFSIVIPTYNGEDYVRFAIESALNQTRKADEIIISDDNSTDSTVAICKEYGNKVKIFINPKGPSGFVNGWNNAIAHATSDYISILHQDDLLAPTFLEEIENAAVVNPDVRHIFVPCDYIDGDGNVLKSPNFCNEEIKRFSGQEYVSAYQTVGEPHIHRCPGVVTHRSIFEVCRYCPEAGHIADDDFFYRVGQYTDVVGVMKPLASYRLHEKSETGHLEYTTLIRRLANDYIYQVKQWKNNPFMEQKSYSYFTYWAKKNVFRELVWGAKNNDTDLYKKGESDLSEIKKLGISFSILQKLYILTNTLMGNKVTRLIIAMKNLSRIFRINLLQGWFRLTAKKFIGGG